MQLLINYLYPLKKNQKKYHIHNQLSYNKFIHKSLNTNNILLLIIDFKKIGLIKIIKILIILIKKKKFDLNFSIFYNFKKEILSHQFLPDWPKFRSKKFTTNLIFWLKTFVLFFIKFRLIKYIVLKLK